MCCTQIYRRTYSWAQNNDIASRGAVITISRTSAAPRLSEEDIERGVSHEIAQVPEVMHPFLHCHRQGLLRWRHGVVNSALAQLSSRSVAQLTAQLAVFKSGATSLHGTTSIRSCPCLT